MREGVNLSDGRHRIGRRLGQLEGWSSHCGRIRWALDGRSPGCPGQDVEE
ncbi:MAG: hypothetical protein AVDCRST_MAG33-2816 [uncultured Thermomicrobiales bacterium]|uniref:Uncharacterized protein n=1 Tax=uncultured Thermomicrobiales bacterium TaxID=1645740 RepID=A0A6J4VHF7_9BACT|nr:MAG: hypothetical protein AVDCRST_MAG33-2816 [uncultured Thermomicrobiales bacterium]